MNAGKSAGTATFDTSYARVNGIKMYYEVYGQGDPLVLIHGGGSTIDTSFGRVIPELSKRRMVLAVELQGHGRTTDRDSPVSFEQDALDVIALLKYLKIEKADFFGFSNGGNTTMMIAIRHPQLVRKIIVASAFFKREGMDPQFWPSMANATLDNMPAMLKAAYLEVAPDPNKLIRMFEKDRDRMLQFTDWSTEDLRAIEAPALIVSGDKDVVMPEHAVEMYRLIPNSHLVILPGEHGKYMGEITTLTNKAEAFSILPVIEEFLQQNDQLPANQYTNK